MMKMRLGVALLAALAVLYGGQAKADYEVMESTVANLPRGASVAENATIAIPAGGQVKLLRTGAGTTHDLKGPYEGTVGDYEASAECPWYKKITVGCNGQSAPIGIRSTPDPDR